MGNNAELVIPMGGFKTDFVIIVYQIFNKRLQLSSSVEISTIPDRGLIKENGNLRHVSTANLHQMEF